MAPSATETVTIPSRSQESSVKLTSNTGPYKELAPIGYEKEAEEEGKDGVAAAKVGCLLSTPQYLLTHL
jgi:sulfonate dioxygenase